MSNWKYKLVKEIMKEKHPEVSNIKFISHVELEGVMWDALDKLEPFIDELEAIVDGRAFDSETGLIWKHRIKVIEDLIKELKKGETK